MNTKPPLETDTIDRLFLELSQVTRARTNRDMDFEFALREANELCRSMYQIAARNGAGTNWETFQGRLGDALDRQHVILKNHGEKK